MTRFRRQVRLASFGTKKNLAEYIPNPQGFLREFTGDDSIRSAMAAQRVRGMDDLLAFLALHSPDAMMDGDGEEAASE